MNRLESLFTVALAQLRPEPLDLDANRIRGIAACRSARDHGADLILFPEMWSTGYTFFDKRHPENIDRWRRLALVSTDEWIADFRAEARRLNMAIALTYLGVGRHHPRNMVMVIDRKGECVLEYAKVHTCSFAPLEDMLEPGEAFYVACLDYGPDVVGIGAMICFDREFPESARVLMLKGAEIILTPNACMMERHRVAQFMTRAFENMTGMALTNYPVPFNNGRSMGVSPEVFDVEEKSRNIILAECDDREQLGYAVFNLASIRVYRDREVWGPKHRRSTSYRRIIEGGPSGVNTL
ncbi:carbon-nitrogen hydrolase family protein [bacterium]|nr:carbon-nitrogen hydrolase family protein [candidate division CSSED10-310 bacterium]